nr:hypothetical protein [Tanacetum cinerariifolium]
IMLDLSFILLLIKASHQALILLVVPEIRIYYLEISANSSAGATHQLSSGNTSLLVVGKCTSSGNSFALTVAKYLAVGSS